MTTITGTSGNDSGGQYDQIASSAANLFFMGQGGNDVVVGGSASDVFFFNAALTAADAINGQGGSDTVSLNGEYGGTHAVVLGATTLVSVEEIDFSGSHNYDITTNDATVAIGGNLKVDASTLGASDSLTFNGSAESNGAFSFVGGAGNDILKGGSSNDTFDLSKGGNDSATGGNGQNTYVFGAAFDANDTINGSGSDIVKLNGDYSAGVTFAASHVSGIQSILLTGGNDYKLTFGAGAIGANIISVDATNLTSADKLTFNGAAQTSSGFTIAFNGGFSAGDHLTGAGNNDALQLNGDYSSGLVLGAATIKGINILGVTGDHAYNLTSNDGNVAAGKTLDVVAELPSAADSLTFNGAAETDGKFHFIGSAGHMNLTGGALGDTFDLGNATADNVIANGGGGNDVFNFQSASFVFSPGDKINGGAGTDTLLLDGASYSDVTLNATTIKNIDRITLTDNSYGITTNDGNVAAGQTMTVDGSVIDTSHVFYFDGAAETNGSFNVIGGFEGDLLTTGTLADRIDISKGGFDTVRAGSGNDVIVAGAAFDSGDVIVGGAGNDTLDLQGNYSGLLGLSTNNLTSVETIKLEKGTSLDLSLNDANVAAGKTLTIDGHLDDAQHRVDVSGESETNGHLNITGGAGLDSLIGGKLADVIVGGAGNDTLAGAGGADHLTGGAGKDTYTYGGATDSTGENHDVLSGFNFSNADKIGLDFALKGVDSAIRHGTLREAHFDADLASDIGNHLKNHSAMLFTASAGTDKGETFLVVDMNGHAGYQAGQDLVIQLDHATHLSSFGASDFVHLI